MRSSLHSKELMESLHESVKQVYEGVSISSSLRGLLKKKVDEVVRSMDPSRAMDIFNRHGNILDGTAEDDNGQIVLTKENARIIAQNVVNSKDAIAKEPVEPDEEFTNDVARSIGEQTEIVRFESVCVSEDMYSIQPAVFAIWVVTLVVGMLVTGTMAAIKLAPIFGPMVYAIITVVVAVVLISIAVKGHDL